MNCVRKHLSRIKGGRLAAACAPAKVVTLTISDVPGDDPAVIASGPTVPDATTCADAIAILQRYGIEVPRRCVPCWRGRAGNAEAGRRRVRGPRMHLIATPQQSLEAAAAAARAAGIEAHILSDEMEGESREVGKVHGALARAVAQRGAPFARPCVILSGGETTVTMRTRAPGTPKGRGGRAGEFCLGLAGRCRGQAERVGAGRRHRRHRRRRGQRRRLRRARHAGARRGAGCKLATTWTATTPTATSTRSATCWSPGPRTPTSTTSGRC